MASRRREIDGLPLVWRWRLCPGVTSRKSVIWTNSSLIYFRREPANGQPGRSSIPDSFWRI
jgi:hypothetical protein